MFSSASDPVNMAIYDRVSPNMQKKEGRTGNTIRMGHDYCLTSSRRMSGLPSQRENGQRASDIKQSCKTSYMDRLGRNFDYRRAKISQDQDPEDDEREDDDEGREGRCWPKRANHGEDCFGYLFDHSICAVRRFCQCRPPNVRLTEWSQTSFPSRRSLIAVFFHPWTGNVGIC